MQSRATRLRRAQGALLGQIVGDALGTSVEFSRASEIARRYPQGLREIVGGGPFRVLPGQVTDDTELALALARSLVRRGGYDPDEVADAYQDWYRSDPFDIGNTTTQAFGGARTDAAGVSARANAHSQANGSLMRISPLAIFGWRLAPAELAHLAVRDVRLSHPHPLCQAAGAVFTYAIARAIREGESPPALYQATLEFARSQELCAPALPALEAASEEAPADFYRHMGWVQTALRNAFFRLLHAADFEEGLVATVMAGGDTDTNGCIAGALLGAAYGLEAIPSRWQRVVLDCKTTRGAVYQAHDALCLAERLYEAAEAPPAAPRPELPAQPKPALCGAEFTPRAESEFGRELRVAVAAVAKASEHLRAEALRAGGPRGAGHHADVDDELEASIVAELLEAFPRDAIVAEEGGSRAGSSGRAWILDPHDGTSDFLRGHRETSISLALVQEGRLVLGIVSCPCLDLLELGDPVRALVGGAPSLLATWAEGDLLRRDGVPLELAPAPLQLEPGARVLVSAKTRGSRLDLNRRLVAPATILPCASIATRFALVACGLGEVALTVRNPLASWDYAGGQALLQGAGGEVTNLEGAPIPWEGTGSPGVYAGGYFGARSLTLAQNLAARYAKSSLGRIAHA